MSATEKPDKSIKEEVEIAQTSSSVDEKPSSPPPKAETPVKEELAKDSVVEKDITRCVLLNLVGVLVWIYNFCPNESKMGTLAIYKRLDFLGHYGCVVSQNKNFFLILSLWWTLTFWTEYALTGYFPLGSKTKRLEHSDSEEEKNESRRKKRRRIKKPEPDSSDDEGKASCKGTGSVLLGLPSTVTLDFIIQLFHDWTQNYSMLTVIPDSPPQLQEKRDPSPSLEIQVKKEPVAVSHSDVSFSHFTAILFGY